jgi:hypothetical protein
VRIAVLVYMVLLAAIVGDAAGQAVPTDRVWLAPSKKTQTQSDWYPQPVTTIVGKVLSLDDQQLSILVAGDEVPSRMAAHRVIWIQPGSRSEKELAGLRLFADGKYGDALRPLIDALSDRPPVWRQQWLSMLAAYAALRSSRGEIAVELVSQLDARPLAPFVVAWLPVAWENRRQPAASIDVARARLNDESPAVRLVAASWLISSPRRKEAAIVLKQLSVDAARPTIAKLAESLLWRIATPPEVMENSHEWQRKLDDLPLVLQTGPMITLAEKFESAGLDRDAAQLRLALKMTRAIPFPIR